MPLKEIVKLVRAAEEELKSPRCDYANTLYTLLSGLNVALGIHKPITILEVCYRDGRKILEEKEAHHEPILG